MILDTIDFTDFYSYVRGIFMGHFDSSELEELMDHVEILADANFRCYKANMIVIENRQTDSPDSDLISEMEWVARSVGEYRVASKAKINKLISNFKTVKEPGVNDGSWITDDVVYSIGEMMDRLSIEFIKREDFYQNHRPNYMMMASHQISTKVSKYLRQKLNEIDEKGYYECIHEQRTYDLEGIVKDLAI